MRDPDLLPRREFLTAPGWPPYSLFVSLEDGLGAPQGLPEIEGIRTRISSLAPDEPGSRATGSGGDRNMIRVDLECDVVVAGGGPAGVCATIAAARHGAKVILVQDRSRLGGNSSSEVKMHMVGANMHTGRPGWREGGILEELRLDDAVNNPQRCWELWDLLLYDKIVSEPNARLLLDTTLVDAERNLDSLLRVVARCDKSEHLYRISAKHFIDCTGDCRLALEAGVRLRKGREPRSEFDEPLAPLKATPTTQGSSILFTARDMGRPVAYAPPQWARRIDDRHLRFRPITSWEYGYWWIEWGGAIDTIHDNERIRFELLSIVTGVWNYIKNSGRFPTAANWAMNWVGMLPGKRESRRIQGEVILTQHSLGRDNTAFDDGVAIGGWGLDEHPSGGFDDSDQPPFVSSRLEEVYNIPLRALYSGDISNLFMAGRNASCSHVAFTSTRVMGTCAVMGQAAGTAAALCARSGITPRQLYSDKPRLLGLRQALLRDDQTIKGLRNEDPLDLARKAKATGSASLEKGDAANALDGWVRDRPGVVEHRWVAPMSADGAWIELEWDEAPILRHIQITFDTGFHRELTLTASDSHNRNIIRGPQPETVRDYVIKVRTADGRTVDVATVRGNHQRLRRHDFEPLEAKAVRIVVNATNGASEAAVYEIRCYG